MRSLHFSSSSSGEKVFEWVVGGHTKKFMGRSWASDCQAWLQDTCQPPILPTIWYQMESRESCKYWEGKSVSETHWVFVHPKVNQGLNQEKSCQRRLYFAKHPYVLELVLWLMHPGMASCLKRTQWPLQTKGLEYSGWFLGGTALLDWTGSCQNGAQGFHHSAPVQHAPPPSLYWCDWKSSKIGGCKVCKPILPSYASFVRG